MEAKKLKITSDGTEIATISLDNGSISVRCTEAGKKICKEIKEGCC